MIWSDHISGTTMITRCYVECSLIVMIAGVDLFQCNDTGNGQGNRADDKGFVGDQTNGFHGQWGSDTHDGQQSGDDVTIAFLCCNFVFWNRT